MAQVVYTLCAATALGCAWLLLRAYARTHARLLLWSGLCFVGLTVNNILVVVDLVLVPNVDLTTLRQLPALLGVLLLVYGLIWDAQ